MKSAGRSRVCDKLFFQSEVKNEIREGSRVWDKLFFQSEVKSEIRGGGTHLSYIQNRLNRLVSKERLLSALKLI